MNLNCVRLNSQHTVVSDLVTANLVQDTLDSVSLPLLNPQRESLIPAQIFSIVYWYFSSIFLNFQTIHLFSYLTPF